MITIIYGPPRVGKTCLMTYLLKQRAFDRERNKLMRKEIEARIEGGFKDLTIPTYSIACNYEAIFRKFRYSPRPCTVINPYKLGFLNQNVKDLHFLPPFTTFGITEAQKYFNSRRFREYPEWQSRFYEAHGHNFYDFYLDTQRPSLIDVNIRELSSFIEVVSMKISKKGFPAWTLREIENSALYDVYVASGKRDRSTFKEYTMKADCDVFSMYESRNLKPLFYAGHSKSDFDYNPAIETPQTRKGYIKYIQDHLKELPEGFYDKIK